MEASSQHLLCRFEEDDDGGGFFFSLFICRRWDLEATERVGKEFKEKTEKKRAENNLMCGLFISFSWYTKH